MVSLPMMVASDCLLPMSFKSGLCAFAMAISSSIAEYIGTSISPSCLRMNDIRISRYRDIDSRRLHGARYTAKYTETLRWGCASVLGYPRRIPETPMAIAWSKQVGLCPTSACSIPIGEWQFGGTCSRHGLPRQPNGIAPGIATGHHPLRWDKVGG